MGAWSLDMDTPPCQSPSSSGHPSEGACAEAHLPKASNMAPRRASEDEPGPRPSVLFLHPDLGVGGAERLVLDAALALQARGCRVRIWTAHYDPAHCFSDSRDVPVRCAGDWLPRSLGWGRRGAAVCAYVRMVYLALYVLFLGDEEFDVVVCDQVRRQRARPHPGHASSFPPFCWFVCLLVFTLAGLSLLDAWTCAKDGIALSQKFSTQSPKVGGLEVCIFFASSSEANGPWSFAPKNRSEKTMDVRAIALPSFVACFILTPPPGHI